MSRKIRCNVIGFETLTGIAVIINSTDVGLAYGTSVDADDEKQNKRLHTQRASRTLLQPAHET